MHVEPSHSIDSTPSGSVIIGHFSKGAEFLTPAGNPQPVYDLLNVSCPKDRDWCFKKPWDIDRASKIKKKYQENIFKLYHRAESEVDGPRELNWAPVGSSKKRKWASMYGI